MGGLNYLLNLCGVLAKECPGAIRAVVFAGEDVSESTLGPFIAGGLCEVVRHRIFDSTSRMRLQIKSLIAGRNRQVESLLKEQRIDVIFESAVFFGWRLGVPAISWMPDFQHRCLPELFGGAARLRREVGFRMQAASARMIMVSSEDSRRLCEEFYPRARGRVRAVRFAVPPPELSVVVGARSVAEKYDLPAHYIFMPNQFWRHKNHLLVVEALRILLDRGCPVTIVATGIQNDPRDPGYAAGVLTKAREAGVGGYFRALGLIPHEDVKPLMIASGSLLNASLFEGWSTSVEEAKSAGVPMILSNLPVHLEQAGESATFFERHSAQALAEVLEGCRPRDVSEAVSQAESAAGPARDRVRGFATDFVNLTTETHARRRL